MKEIDPDKTLSDIVMFDGASNVQLAGRLLKVNYPKLTVICGVEHTVLLFFNYFSKITIVNQIISAHTMIYNIFGSGIFHEPHSIFKCKSQEFQNRNIGVFSGYDTRMSGYSMWMHRDLRMWKGLQDIISSENFIGIPTNNKFDKAVRYICDNNSWERCYILLNIMFPCTIFICLEDSNRAGMDKVYYYSRMTKQYIDKTIYDIDYTKRFRYIFSPSNIWN